MNILAIVLSATLLTWPIVAMAQVKVLMSGGFSGAYEQLLPEFERASGIKVTTGSGASQGSGPQTIGAQLASGVAADLVILSREGLEELVAAKRIAAGTEANLARVGLGVAVRAGTPKPDVGTVEAFKRVVLAARTVSANGIWSAVRHFRRNHARDQRDLARAPFRQSLFKTQIPTDQLAPPRGTRPVHQCDVKFLAERTTVGQSNRQSSTVIPVQAPSGVFMANGGATRRPSTSSRSGASVSGPAALALNELLITVPRINTPNIKWRNPVILFLPPAEPR
jgi:hypothetical protein